MTRFCLVFWSMRIERKFDCNESLLSERRDYEMSLGQFKEKLKILNELVYFDENAHLREKTREFRQMNTLIQEAEKYLAYDQKEERYFLNGLLGNLYRITEQPKQAIIYLTRCLNQAIEEQHVIRESITFIRLGEAYKYDNQHEIALKLFNKALEKCRLNEVNEYIDFAYQHKGKCLMEIGKYDEAEKCFLEALHIRKLKHDGALIDSTEQALQFLKKIRR